MATITQILLVIGLVILGLFAVMGFAPNFNRNDDNDNK